MNEIFGQLLDEIKNNKKDETTVVMHIIYETKSKLATYHLNVCNCGISSVSPSFYFKNDSPEHDRYKVLTDFIYMMIVDKDIDDVVVEIN